MICEYTDIDGARCQNKATEEVLLLNTNKLTYGPPEINLPWCASTATKISIPVNGIRYTCKQHAECVHEHAFDKPKTRSRNGDKEN